MRHNTLRDCLTLAVLVCAGGSCAGKSSVGNGALDDGAGGTGAATPGATGGRSGSGGAPGSGGAGGLNGGGGVGFAGATGIGGSAAGTGGLGGVTGFGGGAGIPGGGYVPPPATRTDILLNGGWQFLRSDATGANAIAFNDSSWAPVALPHTWNAIDGQDGGGYYRGVGWYRRHYVLPTDALGKRVYLQFDGANTVSDIFVNGTSIGQHRGGFARFRFDVTTAMTPGSDNVIAVKVDNSSVPDVPPLSADFTFCGGLYRDVHLLITDNVHIDVEDFASSGVYLDTTSVTSTSASLRSRIRVRNSGTAAQAVTVNSVVVRTDGTVQSRLSATGTVPPGTTQELAATAIISNPHLWNGVADPYVYTVYAELHVGTQVTDSVTTPLGFRSFTVDAARGFSLNGQYVDLHGVDRHQDRINMGWAITNKEHDEDMALIQEMGANIVRLSHYQHAEHFHDLADHAGIVLWAEIPLVNGVTNSAAFTANARSQLTELIRQNYNHPAILFWGVGNEQRVDDAPTNTLLTDLNTLVHSEDPGRLSTYAHCCTSNTTGLPTHTDVVGHNVYFGWYTGTYDQFGAWADGLHAQVPTFKLGVSEYGAGASVIQHADPPAQPVTTSTFHPEEWQTLLHESHWKQMKTRPYLWSKIIWNMFDFASDSRTEGDTLGRNDKGMVTYDRKIKKDAFFWYKANWTNTPVVYITSRRFTPRTTATASVRIYSNLDSVQLTVNGTTIGSLTSTDHIFLWPNVALTTGNNAISAIGTMGATTLTDAVTWTRM